MHLWHSALHTAALVHPQTHRNIFSHMLSHSLLHPHSHTHMLTPTCMNAHTSHSVWLCMCMSHVHANMYHISTNTAHVLCIGTSLALFIQPSHTRTRMTCPCFWHVVCLNLLYYTFLLSIFHHIHVCSQHGCCAVSKDSDFFIFDLPAGYIPVCTHMCLFPGALHVCVCVPAYSLCLRYIVVYVSQYSVCLCLSSTVRV